MSGAMIDTYATNVLTSRLISGGMAASDAAVASRLVSSTGVGIAFAPLTTAVTMYFDDHPYTSIDYAARMGRSTVAGTGGALATAAWFAYAGTSLGPVGTLVGFGVGFLGYVVVDAVAGDEVESGIRGALGEGGCTTGVGPGH
jgi:hypothetical protein